ncbi:MltA domain-containing protein [Modicisalibacter tunisiensis]|uniref:murein transglycosylase A n=1 Tax=Modicisalibacter tunisiensis TaxID=390637 RepID=UPI0007928BD8|nr:MltA domain-containing protein [Modicisalibacter tunisiensis]KXS38214.1 MAG: membrane-bound lytic murein transglycosylase A [Halomonadaceae bacterium T82-2]MBZ9539690.1 MltA domain-containing protein [Modicisalibacter tunisiensis]
MIVELPWPPAARGVRSLILVLLLALLAACSSQAPQPTEPPSPVEQQLTRQMHPMDWQDLPGWRQENAVAALGAFRQSCRRLARRDGWAAVCRDAEALDPLDSEAIRDFFERRFAPYLMVNADGSTTGLITGYYEPLLHGSRRRHGPYQTPLYRLPDAWRSDPDAQRPSRAALRKSGRLAGQELVWVDDPIEAAYLQIQGSGRIELAEGGTLHVGYAGTNNQPFRSFARALIDRGAITPGEATLDGIRAWARRHPDRVQAALDVNPRVVFFQPRESDPRAGADGPVGALGVPLTSRRSLAVDPSRIPLGAPVFLATTRPLSNTPLQQLMVAQDTGSAITGAVRADFFWGHGDQAGELAGRMKQPGQLWVLMPRQRR